MCANVGLPPTRSWRPAPVVLPRLIRAPVMVTVRPMCSSRPVPRYRLPKRAEVYQSLCQPAACRWPTTLWASQELSPPCGPNAVAPAGASDWARRACAGDGAGEGLAFVAGDGATATGWLALAAGLGRLCPAVCPVVA